ncbi:MAG: MFS transporter [Lachnospiraceae bacterium]|nr:MFS transporter [Lachnospiraceae bacterium]
MQKFKFKIGKKEFNYSWVIFAVSFLMVFVSLGFINTVKSLYLAPITNETGISRMVFSLSDCCRYIVIAGMNMMFGTFINKFNPRAMVAFGFGFLIIAVTLYSIAHTAIVFCIGGVFLGLGLAWTTTTMVGFFVEKWFTTAKGSVMGIILAASGAGGAVATQIMSPIINYSASSWRQGYRLMAVILLVTGVLVVLLLRNNPKEVGMKPFSKKGGEKKKRGSSWTGFEEKDIFRKSWFYVVIGCFLFYGILLQAYVSTAAAHFRDIGIDNTTIANVISIYSVCLFIAKMAVGALFDRFGLRKVLTVCSIGGAATLFFLANVGNSSAVYIYAPLSVFALPIETVLLPLLTLDLFGQKAYARIMGIIVGTVQLGYCGGSLIPNYFFDRFGTYRGIYTVFGCLVIVTVIAVNFCITKAHKERKLLEAAQEQTE